MSYSTISGPNRYTETRHTTLGQTCNHFLGYDLTCDEYDQLMARAGGCCELCKTPEEKTVRGSLVIDHFQGRDVFFVRGLLCDKCNSVMARHDRTVAWGPASLPLADKARQYHLNAFDKPSPEELRAADEIIQTRKPYDVRQRIMPPPTPKKSRRISRVPRVRLDHTPLQISRAIRKHLTAEQIAKLIDLLTKEDR